MATEPENSAAAVPSPSDSRLRLVRPSLRSHQALSHQIVPTHSFASMTRFKRTGEPPCTQSGCVQRLLLIYCGGPLCTAAQWATREKAGVQGGLKRSGGLRRNHRLPRHGDTGEECLNKSKQGGGIRGGSLQLKSKNSKLLFSTVACTESARTAVVPQRLCSLIKFWNITDHFLGLDFAVSVACQKLFLDKAATTKLPVSIS